MKVRIGYGLGVRTSRTVAALIPYSMSEVPEVVVAGLAKRRPDLTDPAALVPIGFDALVVVPLDEPTSTNGWRSHLAEAATALLPLQT